MSLLKLVFVLLILIPVALVMMYIVNNLLDEAKRAKTDTIDLDEVREVKRKNKKKAKRKASAKPRAKKEKTAAAASGTGRPAKKTARKSSSKPARKSSSKPAQPRRQQSARPQQRRAEMPPMEPVKDKSQSYIEEYNRKRSELESNSRRAGKRNTMEEFDLLYGGSSSGKSSSGRSSSGKRSSSKRSSKKSTTSKRKK